VTGVPVSIQRYFALMWAKLMLDRVDLDKKDVSRTKKGGGSDNTDYE
jgi:hypothetical protein